jgi:hypothetical protein
VRTTLPGDPVELCDLDTPEACALTWIPLAVRYKLDTCGLRISLASWQAVSVKLRRGFLEAPIDTEEARTTFVSAASSLLAATSARNRLQEPGSFSDYLLGRAQATKGA